MAEAKGRFNPEPWVRSALWLVAAVILAISFAFRMPLKISGAEFGVELGGKSLAVSSGDTSIGRDARGSIFVSRCRRGTRAIGGSCVIKSGLGVRLQNFGPEQDSTGVWQFACVWDGMLTRLGRALVERASAPGAISLDRPAASR